MIADGHILIVKSTSKYYGREHKLRKLRDARKIRPEPQIVWW
jgi:hypothetical protein